VLFSYNGKAIKKKEPRYKDETGDNVAVESYKIIDYATLVSWYNENKFRENKAGENNARESQVRESHTMASAVGERIPAPEYSMKQRELKFLMQ